MLSVNRWVIALAVLCAVVVGAFLEGKSRGWKQGFEAGFAKSEQKWLAWQEKAQAESKARENELLERGDLLAAELERARANVQIRTVRVVRVIKQKASNTVACLSPPVVQALNEGNPVAAEQPPGSTSEAAMAQWAAEAQQAHEACRAQIGALASYVRKLTGDRL